MNIFSYLFYRIEIYLIIILSLVFFVWNTSFRIMTQTNKQELMSRSNTRNFTVNYKRTPWLLFSHFSKINILIPNCLIGIHTAFRAGLYFSFLQVLLNTFSETSKTNRIICVLLKATITFKTYWFWPLKSRTIYRKVNTFNS